MLNITEKENGTGTEVIKLAVQSYANRGYSPIHLLGETAQWLWESYKKTNDKVCLESAVDIVKAYMEIGFIYEKQKELFDQILSEFGTSKQELFPSINYSNHIFKATPQQIRSVLGRWPKSNGKDPSVDEIVKDILGRIQRRIPERKAYKRGNNDTFELIVMENGAMLMDLEKNCIYTFE